MQMQIASNGVGIEVSVLVVKGECYDAQHKLDFEHIFNSYMLFSQPFSQKFTRPSLLYVSCFADTECNIQDVSSDTLLLHCFDPVFFSPETLCFLCSEHLFHHH